MRESSPPRPSRPRERTAGPVRADEEGDAVPAGGPSSRSPTSTRNSPSPMPSPWSSSATASTAPASARAIDSVFPASRRAFAARPPSPPPADRRRTRPGPARPVRRRPGRAAPPSWRRRSGGGPRRCARAPPRQLRAGRARPPRRRKRGGRGLADTDLGLAEVGGHLAELRSERGHGLERATASAALGGAGSVRLLGVERLGGGAAASASSVTAKAAALGHRPLLVARFHPLCAGDELLELREALPRPARPRRARPGDGALRRGHAAPASSARRRGCSSPTKASSTSSWCEGGRAGAARTGRTWRAAARRRQRDPHAARRGPRICAVRPSANTRATAGPSSAGRSSATAACSGSSRTPSGRSSSASTYASSAPGPGIAGVARAPSRARPPGRRSSCAPVSPVIAFRPGARRGRPRG